MTKSLPDHAGIGSNGERASPKSAAEAEAEKRIIDGIRQILTPDFLAQCALRHKDLEWFLSGAELLRDRIQRTWRQK